METPKTTSRVITLFAFPFRIFFLSSAFFAALLIPLWLLTFHFNDFWLSPLPALFWHQHEMLNGFLNPAIAGFILTAICNWTGTPPVAGRYLFALWLLWLAGRVTMFFGADIPIAAAVIDLLFMPIVATIIATKVFMAKQWRQLPLLFVLLLLWTLDVLFHLRTNPVLLHALVLLGALLIVVVGGRITPAFTGNWFKKNGYRVTPRNPTALNITGLVFAALLVACELLQLRGYGAAVIAFIAAAILFVRVLGWFGWHAGKEPLLWILHLGHLWVVAGYIFWGMAAIKLISASVWVHALGAGAIATMILGVMTRVAMGHTGRPMRLLPGMLWGYIAIIVAGVIRVINALAAGWPPLQTFEGLSTWLHAGLWLSAVLWLAAFSLFVYQYGPVLMAPRADGKQG